MRSDIILSIVILCLLLFGIAWEQFVIVIPNNNFYKTIEEPSAATKQDGEKPKLILSWRKSNIFTGLNGYMEKNGYNCRFTDDKALYKQSTAVLFSGKSQPANMELPDLNLRKPEQYFVYWTKEAPAKLFGRGNFSDKMLNNKQYDSMFNLSWYFRQDADIAKHFGTAEFSLHKSYESGLNNFTYLMKQKSELVGWAVSNCDRTKGARKRMEYAKQMISAGLDLTTFGECFDNYSKDEIRFFTHFKFCLAFENSIHCPDYITEKFWSNSLNQGAVPIVFGPTKADLDKIAPKNSYILVDDFASPADLVEYLNYLDSNNEAYLEYHKWRLNEIQKENLSINLYSEYGQLCSILNKYPAITKTYSSMSDWLFSDKYYVDNECLFD